MKALYTAAAMVIFVAPCFAQGVPGTNLSVEPQVVEVERRADTLVVTYLVRNALTSREALWTFTIAAPAHPLEVAVAAPANTWTATNRWGSYSVARWTLLDSLVPPGGTSPPYRLRAVGILGLVQYYAGGDWPVPEADQAVPGPRGVSDQESLAARAARGVTVGIVPTLPNEGSTSLVERLRTTLLRVCALRWVSDATLCRSLEVKLEQAVAALERGRENAARGALRAFAAEVAAQRGSMPGKQVSEPAYYVLAMNAEFILGTIH